MSRGRIDKKLAALAAAGVGELHVHVSVEGLTGALNVRIAYQGRPLAVTVGCSTFEDELTCVTEQISGKLRAEAEKARELAELATARAESLS